MPEKLECLAWYNKKLNQTYVRKGLPLFHNNPPLKELISQWIQEEICFLERKVQLQKLNSPDKDKFIDEGNEGIKIITGLSVPQIACFVRLLVETGIFKKPNKEDILKFIPATYRSKRMGEFAYGSFRSKCYGIQESIKEDVREMLILMLNELKKL